MVTVKYPLDLFYEDEFEGGVLMGAVKKIEEPIDISFMLLMKYRKPVISLSELLPDCTSPDYRAGK